MGSGGLGTEGGVSRSNGIGARLGGFWVGRGGGVRQRDPSRKQVDDALSELYAKLHGRYLAERLCSPALKATAGEVFRHFRVEVLLNRSWDSITERFGIDGGPGCLLRYVNEFALRGEIEGSPSEAQRSFARQCLEDLFIRALGNNINLYLTGTADAVLAAMDSRVFDDALTAFVGSGLRQLAERTANRLPRGAREALREVTDLHARRLCDRFRARYSGRPFGDLSQVAMTDMFQVLADPAAADWFITELRKL
jgi:hypothetical protein